MSLEKAPRWFLAVALVSLISVLPLLVSQSNRLAILETQVEAIGDQRRDDNERIITLLDRLNITTLGLTETVASLKTEVKNIKER